MIKRALQWSAAMVLTVSVAHAQSSLGELLDKGGKKLQKDETTAMLPFVVKYLWPQGGGEGSIVFHADGTVSGSEYHYGNRSESPAVGSWVADDTGKVCIKKSMSAWNVKTDQCWYMFRTGDVYFQGQSDADRAAKVFPLKSVTKHQ